MSAAPVEPPGRAEPPGPTTRALDRQILALAVPALGALVAEPLFVLVDTAAVGRLGRAELAGLTLASTLLVTAVGLFIFLAYATTATVARRMGAGDTPGALRSGVDGMWLAAGLGVAVAAVGIAAAPWLATSMGASPDVAPHAVAYLRYSLPGLPGMLVVLAATGALRGLLDVRTPLVVAVTGAIVNAVLNVVLIYGLGLGIAGSGAGTAITQLGMGAVLAVVVSKGARAHAVPMRPSGAGVLAGARAGGPLFVRTLTLRAAILLTVWVATSLGDTPLAAHQIVNSLWGLTAFALDALAIAAQAMIGHALGAGDAERARAVMRRTVMWGVLTGAVLGVVIAAGAGVIPRLFSTDDDVRAAAVIALAVCAALLPLAGWVFVLDGVLMGAGDGRFLAVAGVITLVAYLPLALAVWWAAPAGGAGLAWLWLAFGGGFMLARAATTGWRARGDGWLRLGAPL